MGCTQKFNAEIIELQHLNDSLSYFKLKISSKPTSQEPFTNIYKYYIVEQNGALFLDNCRVYDTNRFVFQQTKNINFYISPFYKISKKQLKKASQSFDSLYVRLQTKRPKSPITYFMCSSEEELNNLANIVVWDGGLTGFTNIPEGYVVGINDNPVYTHEFVHAILGYGANCFFLQEGIATLYGGTDKGRITYEKGIKDLKKCYQNGGCDFEKLYAREVGTQYSSSLTYTFGAVFCKFLIENYGFEKFYTLYYDKSITTQNFMEKVEQFTGKSKSEIKSVIEGMILK